MENSSVGMDDDIEEGSFDGILLGTIDGLEDSFGFGWKEGSNEGSKFGCFNDFEDGTLLAILL